MGLLADLTANFLNIPAGFIRLLKRSGILEQEEMQTVATAVKEAIDSYIEGIRDQTPAGTVAMIATMGIIGVPAGMALWHFKAKMFEGWTSLLTRAFDNLNIETEAPVFGPQLDIQGQIAATLQRGRAAAQQRVVIALTLINAVVVAGNAASIAAEALSGGTVRSIAEAIQSWVWANGLGSFAPLAFQPQIQASIAPYLLRHYNSRAQAQIPPVTDVIRFQLREVFLAGRREELVGTEDRPIFDALMREHGFNQFHADSYWGAHWQLPSTGQLNEMLHRGVIDDATWERFIRFNDMEPTSIPRLHDIIFSAFTRVDVRRMARMGLLSDDELLQAYADVGYFAPTRVDPSGRLRATFVSDPDFTVHKAQALVVFTKVFNAVPELRQRFSKGWIDSDEVRQGLLDTGLSPGRVELLAQTIIKTDGPARTAPEKELTRGLVARAWKLRLISFPQARFLLQRMGWSAAEAELILRVQSQPDDPLAFAGTQLGARLTPLGVAISLDGLSQEEE